MNDLPPIEEDDEPESIDWDEMDLSDMDDEPSSWDWDTEGDDVNLGLADLVDA